MSKAKKVIFVIVEGPTDKDALSSVLKQIFSSAEVHHRERPFPFWP